MKLSFEDFLTKLARGQLKNTAATDDQQDGIIAPKYEEQLLELTNQGLTDITTKKKLFENFATLTFVDGQNLYVLPTDVGEDYENMVRVLEVATADGRKHTPKSNANILMPSPESLRFSTQFMKTYPDGVEVRFQISHPEVESVTGEINLPKHLFEALVLYVAGLYLSHMGGKENTEKGDSYYGLYLRMLNDDTIDNASGTSELVDEDTRFQDRGFV